ncbi:MAG TPA: ATP-binding protein [Flavobacterium sp.]|jgi:PAS domain S-box-containing protein
MSRNETSGDILFDKTSFDLLIKLYKSSFLEYSSLDNVYKTITKIAVEGLHADRAGYWEIREDRLVCLSLYDNAINEYVVQNDLLKENLSVYFQALKDGIAIIADDALTHSYTQELKNDYLIPLGINVLLGLPIMKNGELIGVFCCERRNAGAIWKPSNLTFARLLCDILTLMIEQSERRELERELIESERKLSLITNNSNDGFLVFENSAITYFSESYSKLLGYTKEDISNFSIQDIFDLCHPEDRERVNTLVYTNLANKVSDFKYEFRIKDKSGNYFWREDTVSVIYGDQGLYSKYIIISRDISTVKKAEAEIYKLYNISKNLNDRLIDFTHIISHNIRSNTSNISMIVELLNHAESENERNEYLKLLKESNEKLSETIFHLSKTINTQLNPVSENTNLNVKHEIEKVLKGINGIIRAEKAIITLDIEDDLTIETIVAYFESIILNLVTNAIKYKSPERRPNIVIKANRLDEKLHITITDNGLGIDLDKNENKIFGIYKTFHGNKDAVGLGLYMVKNHVIALGGTIQVESEVGVGTTFTIVL